jgi:hypothetical protein
MAELALIFISLVVELLSFLLIVFNDNLRISSFTFPDLNFYSVSLE